MGRAPSRGDTLSWHDSDGIPGPGRLYKNTPPAIICQINSEKPIKRDMSISLYTHVHQRRLRYSWPMPC